MQLSYDNNIVTRWWIFAPISRVLEKIFDASIYAAPLYLKI